MPSDLTRRLLAQLEQAPPTVPLRLAVRPDEKCGGCGCKLVAAPSDFYPQIHPTGPRFHPVCITTARNLAALPTTELPIA